MDKNLRIKAAALFALISLAVTIFIYFQRSQEVQTYIPEASASDLEVVCTIPEFVSSLMVSTLLDDDLQDIQNSYLAHALINQSANTAYDDIGRLFIADSQEHVIRMIDLDGTETIFAGIPGVSGFADGEAFEATFNSPMGIAVLQDGLYVYVADTGNHLIRAIRNGQVRTLAGTIYTDPNGTPLGGFSHRPARLYSPVGMALVDGVLIVADSGNHLIRAVWPWGQVAPVAGSGEPGCEDGPANLAAFYLPTGVFVDGDYLFILDTGNDRIRKMPMILSDPGG